MFRTEDTGGRSWRGFLQAKNHTKTYLRLSEIEFCMARKLSEETSKGKPLPENPLLSICLPIRS